MRRIWWLTVFCVFAVGTLANESKAADAPLCYAPFSGKTYIDCLEARCEALGVPKTDCEAAAQAVINGDCQDNQTPADCFVSSCESKFSSSPDGNPSPCWIAGYVGNRVPVIVPNFFCDATACSDADIGAKAPISITTRVIACTKQTIDILFNPKQCPQKYIGAKLQDYVTVVVGAVLTLATVILGIKIMLKGSISKAEVMTFLLQFGVILWLCVGTGMTDFVYTGAMAILGDLPNFLMGASTGMICNYDVQASPYPPGMSYLLTWDIIDCRIAHYLLLGMTDGYLPLGVFQAIIPLIYGLQIVTAIILIILGIFILSLAANFLYIVVLAMLSIAILTYVGFIFVPMMIFAPTKDIFNKWWQAVLSCALQPVVIAGIISVVFLVFDQIVYSDCTFPKNTVTGSTGKQVWILATANSPNSSNGCEKSIGYHFFNKMVVSSLDSVSLVFFDIIYFKGLDLSGFVDLLLAGVKALIFCYLFMMIASKGSEFASKLTSGPEIGKFAIGASAVIDAIMAKLGKEDKPEDQGSGSEATDKKDGGKGGGGGSAPRPPAGGK